MSISSTGILVYGVDLGGYYVVRPLLPKEVVKYDESLDEEGTGEDVYTYLERGCKENGTTLVVHCAYEYPMYIIGTDIYRAHRGYPKQLKLRNLYDPSTDEDNRINATLAALKIDPTKVHEPCLDSHVHLRLGLDNCHPVWYSSTMRN